MTSLGRILMLGYEYPPVGGGGGKAMARLAADAVEAGYRVHVVTTSYQELPRYERQGQLMSIERVAALRARPDRSGLVEMASFAASSAWALLRARREFQPDLVHVFFGLPSGPGALLAHRLTGQPYIVSARGSDVPRPQVTHLKTLYRLSRPFLRSLWRNAAAVVAVSDDLRQAIWDALPGLPVEVIPNGVDTGRFRPAERTGSGPVRLLAVGRLQYFKGFQHLLAALASLSSNAPEWELKIVGDGPYRQHLETLVDHLRVRSRVRLVSWMDHEAMAAVYQDADILVSPSELEGLPNTVLEAMASGLPVIATAVAGNRALVQSGITGLLVPPSDPAALSRALECLLCDPELRARHGKAGRTIATSEFDWKRVNQAYLRLYRQTTDTSDGKRLLGRS